MCWFQKVLVEGATSCQILRTLGYFKSYEESSKKILDKQKKIIFKTKYKEHLKYQKLIQIYKNIYLRNKDIFSKISSFLNE